ncbi:EMSY domain-containing protein [Artemisia annua]|uniref:EMSY domain-containing protein n=1 Tax=Artemisia annua TaxID=35608 RepID=A0A2U1LSS3_ARTAN|nr:EMSY domain-containing protein [Artemisia annua]
MMQHEMESQIHYLEQVAYSSVLRAFKAQSDALSWEKEGLITELRKELRVSDDEHRELLAKVNTDEIITSIREWRSSGGTRSAMLNIPQSIHDPMSPTISASRKRQKTNMPLSLPSQSFPGLGSGIQTPKPSPRYPLMGRTPRGMPPNHGSSVVPIANEANDAGTRDYLVGRKLRTRWPADNTFYEAVIVDYNPIQGRHALVYNKNTPQETFEWVNLNEIRPEDIQWIGEDSGTHQSQAGQGHGFSNQVGHGVGRGRGNFREQTQTGYPLLQNGDMKASDEIEILHTDTLIKEVEKVFDTTQPDLLEIEKAKKMLKEHERALIDVIAKLAEASNAPDSDSGGDHRFMHGQAVDGELAQRTMQYGSYQYGRSDGTAMARGSIRATDNQPEEYVDIE